MPPRPSPAAVQGLWRLPEGRIPPYSSAAAGPAARRRQGAGPGAGPLGKGAPRRGIRRLLP